MRQTHYLLLVGSLLYAVPSYGQEPPADSVTCSQEVDLTSSTLSDTRRSLWRGLSVATLPRESGFFRSNSMRFSACADSLPFLAAWQRYADQRTVQPLPLEFTERSNSAYPRSVNDGAAWLGSGFNLSVAGGVRARWKFLNVQLAPELHHQQNDSHVFARNTQPGRSEFANAYHPDIDYPTRFGDDAFSTFSPGQSFVQAVAGPVAFTAGVENLWIGAADVYPILLSYTAPGFPHLRIGTQRPLDLRVVDVEFHLVFASLSESDYFDGPDEHDEHYFTTTMAVIKPHFLPGLSLAVARAYHDTAKATGQGFGFYAERLVETPFGGLSSGNRIGNAIGVLLARWILPESHFEVYAEWSREDTPADWTDVLREPDWTQAYVLGFQKAFVRPNRLIRFYGELIHLGESPPARAGRGFFSYYTHGLVRQGHTNDGQLLGAAIGPGSDAALLGVDVFSASGRSAFRIERARYDEDAYYRTFARRFGETRHDAEITVSASRTHLVRSFELEAGIAYSRRYGRGFIPLASDGPDLVENNWATRLSAAWRPPW